MHSKILQLERRIARLEQHPTQIRPGLNTRVDRNQNRYTIHADTSSGKKQYLPQPWTFSATTTEDPQDSESTIPALALSTGSHLWDYAGASGQVAIATEFPFPLDPATYPAGDYHIGLRVNYSSINPMLPEGEPTWLDAQSNPCPAIIQVTSGNSAPSPFVTGTDPNATILQHTISVGLLTIDAQGNLTITNLRPGQIITLWPAAIEGLPTSLPLF